MAQANSADAREFLKTLKEADIKLSGPEADTINIIKKAKPSKDLAIATKPDKKTTYKVTHDGEKLTLNNGKRITTIGPDGVELTGGLRNVLRRIKPASQSLEVTEKLFKTKIIKLLHQKNYSEVEAMYTKLASIHEKRKAVILTELKAMKFPHDEESNMGELVHELKKLSEKTKDYAEKAAFYKEYPNKLKAQ